MPALTDWDRRLIDRHLAFYEALANGQRPPATDEQRRFVEVCQGQLPPRTQHEIAYQRYLAQHRAKDGMKGTDAGADLTQAVSRRPGDAPFAPADRAEAAVDAIEAVELSGRPGRTTARLLRTVKDAYQTGAASAAARSSEAALWLSALTADRDWSALVGQMSGDAFNTLSNVYTKAMDGAFAEGLKSGNEYISPAIHRLIDGRHDLAGSWEAVRGALPDDNILQEFVGWTWSYTSDLASSTGMPIATISEETFRALDSVLRSAPAASEMSACSKATVAP